MTSESALTAFRERLLALASDFADAVTSRDQLLMTCKYIIESVDYVAPEMLAEMLTDRWIPMLRQAVVKAQPKERA